MNRRRGRKFEILHCAMMLFLKKGYNSAYITTIAKELNISTGNLTFYFPSKEHLLAELTKELCQFQWELMEREVRNDYSPLMAYLLEVVTIASMCEENLNIKDFFVSAYTHSLSLKIIRENDTWKMTEVFGEYCLGWTEKEFMQAENIVSGIEYSLLMMENTDEISLEERVAASLDAIMKIFNVPKELREQKIKKVLAMNYRIIGRDVFEDFCRYVEEKNKEQFQKI